MRAKKIKPIEATKSSPDPTSRPSASDALRTSHDLARELILRRDRDRRTLDRVLDRRDAP